MKGTKSKPAKPKNQKSHDELGVSQVSNPELRKYSFYATRNSDSDEEAAEMRKSLKTAITENNSGLLNFVLSREDAITDLRSRQVTGSATDNRSATDHEPSLKSYVADNP